MCEMFELSHHSLHLLGSITAWSSTFTFIPCSPAGHSRSIVGLEQRKNGRLCLLIVDPGFSVPDTRKLLSRDISTAIRHIRKFPSNLKHKQYQVVAVQGVLSAEAKQVSCHGTQSLVWSAKWGLWGWILGHFDKVRTVLTFSHPFKGLFESWYLVFEIRFSCED